MESNIKSILGKFAYGGLFIGVLPVSMVLWAVNSEDAISLPAVHLQLPGAITIAVGILFMVIGMMNLVRYGKGLPMSAFPPETFVSRGIYGHIPHPIYTGACITAVGVSLFTGSASGLWLVSPVFILSCAAYVIGYENIVLRKRFPSSHTAPLLSVPPAVESSPSAWNRLSAILFVFGAWATVYLLVGAAGTNEQFTMTPTLSVRPQLISTIASVLYFLGWGFVVLTPLVAKSKRALHTFTLNSLTGLGASVVLIFTYPAFARAPSGTVLPGFVYVAFPSIHTALCIIVCTVYRERFKRQRAMVSSIAVLCAIGGLLAGFSSVADIVGGLAVAGFALYRRATWTILLRASERIANSWKEWDFGAIRVMNHGLYGGLAAFTGIIIMGTLIGAQHLPAILFVTVSTLVGAALWAQFIEGSRKLLRPLGFYGGIIGGTIGCAIADQVFHVDFLLIYGSLAISTPFVQAIGRVRCLVQGCCHGGLTDAAHGIRYFHQRSRVTRLSDLGGRYLHPTPLYSIASNITGGIILVALWIAGTSLPLIIGLSFIANGLSRFVEEALRGEPQTVIVAGLRLYQWIALASIIIGAAVSTVATSTSIPDLEPNPTTMLIALAGGLLATGVTGIDFPRSDRRFSRLV